MFGGEAHQIGVVLHLSRFPVVFYYQVAELVEDVGLAVCGPLPVLVAAVVIQELIANGHDVFGEEMPTSIDSPLIQVIEADGSHRYFDLQGRQLNDKPHTGVYIKNGKKYNDK